MNDKMNQLKDLFAGLKTQILDAAELVKDHPEFDLRIKAVFPPEWIDTLTEYNAGNIGFDECFTRCLDIFLSDPNRN